jgi:hypothetical protein
MENYINEQIAKVEKWFEMKAARKAEIKAQAEEKRAAVKVGSIFCYSWGWEQTNIDFFQVVEVKGKSTVVVREIARKTVNETGWASDEVVPAVNQFIGEPETVRLNQYGGISRRCGTASLTDPKQKHYRSWYA